MKQHKKTPAWTAGANPSNLPLRESKTHSHHSAVPDASATPRGRQGTHQGKAALVLKTLDAVYGRKAPAGRRR
ncbi:MAG: hypothetical protein LBC63_09805 [Holophagales bacterium]|nr:hypothetical protein [Holophagales bacterium]